jgi:ComF family protein
MADSIFRFKYLGRQEYAIFYGRELQQSYGAWLQGIRPDALVPVPIHPSRRRERGYNQAELIAKALSAQSGIPVDLRLISRTKKTLPQKNLTREERQNNLKRAFKINRNDVKLNVIVIIDDIYTTGSTIDAMAEVLLQAGVGKIYCMTLAAGRGI